MNRIWDLWLDDLCNHPEATERHTPPGFKGAASIQEAKDLVEKYGCPSFMSLDHDLANDERSIDFLKWLSENYFSSPPKWVVHSANPVGRDNLNAFMNSWHKAQ